MEKTSNILEVKNLTVEYFSKFKTTVAVKDVSFNLERGKVLGIVGESGSGKSTVAFSIMRLINTRYTRVTQGEVLFQETDLLKISDRELQNVRGRDIAMIFQNPSTALDPVYTVGDQIIEAITIHERISYKKARVKAISLLTEVGIINPAEKIDSYPHEFSGGMKQRVLIAIAIACNPKVIIADEPTTALDVITQDQILQLLSNLCAQRNISMIFITHDMGVVAQFCDDMLVMRNGEIIERGTTIGVFANPQQAYTQKLLLAVPSAHEDQDWLLTSS